MSPWTALVENGLPALFFHGTPQLLQAHPERNRDASRGGPGGVGLAPLDAGQRGSGQRGVVGEVFLGLPTEQAQAAHGRREGLVGLGWSGHGSETSSCQCKCPGS